MRAEATGKAGIDDRAGIPDERCRFLAMVGEGDYMSASILWITFSSDVVECYEQVDKLTDCLLGDPQLLDEGARGSGSAIPLNRADGPKRSRREVPVAGVGKGAPNRAAVLADRGAQ
jgi:hypothetical protein